jgi:hypothetical protein
MKEVPDDHKGFGLEPIYPTDPTLVLEEGGRGHYCCIDVTMAEFQSSA